VLPQVIDILSLETSTMVLGPGALVQGSAIGLMGLSLA